MNYIDIFPEFINEFKISDDVFEKCYEGLEPSKRAWLKKTIAQVYGAYSPDSPVKKWTVDTYKAGFEVEAVTQNVDGVVLLIDKKTVSAVRVLAALVPAFACGINNSLVVFTGTGSIDEQVLTGLELAGQEDITVLDDANLQKFYDEILDSNQNIGILDLRGKAEPIKYSSNIRYWRAPEVKVIGVCSGQDEPDIDIINFAHNDLEIKEIAEDQLDQNDVYAVVVSPELVGEALENFNLVLSCSQEGCWIWPNLDLNFFKVHSKALAAI